MRGRGLARVGETVATTLRCRACGDPISRVPDDAARQVTASTCVGCNRVR